MKKNVFIADDNELVCSLLSKICESVGLNPVCVRDAGKAQEMIQAGEIFSLAMIDLIMPNGSGWDIIDCMQKSPSHADIPIVVITGAKISEEERERVLEKAVAIIDKSEFNVERMQHLISSQALKLKSGGKT